MKARYAEFAIFALTVIFVVGKLTGTLSWSWWWVLSPLWITLGICVLWYFLGFLFGLGLILIAMKYLDS